MSDKRIKAVSIDAKGLHTKSVSTRSQEFRHQEHDCLSLKNAND